MTLESVNLAVLLLRLPPGVVVENFAIARQVFGQPAGAEPSPVRPLWPAWASVPHVQVVSWICAAVVPRDPSHVAGRSADFHAWSSSASPARRRPGGAPSIPT